MSNIEQTLSIIKPDAVERNLIDEIKIFLLKINLKLKKAKKFKLLKMRQLNFIRFINLNHFTMNYVLIFHLDQFCYDFRR